MQAQTSELVLLTQELIAITYFIHAGIVTPGIILAGDEIAISIDNLTSILSSEENPLSEECINQIRNELDRTSLQVMPVAHA